MRTGRVYFAPPIIKEGTGPSVTLDLDSMLGIAYPVRTESGPRILTGAHDAVNLSVQKAWWAKAAKGAAFGAVQT